MHRFQSLRQLNNEIEYAQGARSVRGPALFYLTLVPPDGHGSVAYGPGLICAWIVLMVLNPCVKFQLARVVFFPTFLFTFCQVPARSAAAKAPAK